MVPAASDDECAKQRRRGGYLSRAHAGGNGMGLASCDTIQESVCKENNP